jgi:UDP-glucose:(heptosyl)LPS alpha-1,3-glucosyltransferase
MRVAIIQETIETARGGAETSTLEMARRLAELGLDVSIIFRGRQEGPFMRRGVMFLPIEARGPTRAFRTYRFVQTAQRMCRIGAFDIVHAITPCLCANVYQPRGGTYPESIERSLAIVRSRLWRELKRLGRRFNIRQRFLARLESLLLRRRAGQVMVAAVSNYVRQQVISAYGFPAARVRVIFNGVETPLLSAEEVARYRSKRRELLGLSGEAPLVLFVAHNFRLKGLGELLRASVAGEWAVLVIGNGRTAPYQRLAARLGLSARVHFAGAGRSVAGWYGAADVLAHPTWYDPCSRVVLEALSSGLPVVTTRYNGAAEVIEPGRNGEVIEDPGDYEELAAAIRRALRPQVRQWCLEDAAATRERLSMARHARELKALYEEICTG